MHRLAPSPSCRTQAKTTQKVQLMCKVICGSPEHVAGADAERAPCCCTIAAVGVDVERLPCHIVATVGADAKVSSAVISSHCSSMAAWHVCVLGLYG